MKDRSMDNKEESQRHLQTGNDFYVQGDYKRAWEMGSDSINWDNGTLCGEQMNKSSLTPFSPFSHF